MINTFNSDINYLAVLAAPIISMAIGFPWYGTLFGKRWMNLVGINENNINKDGMGQIFGMTALASLTLAFVLAHFIDLVGATTLAEGLQVGFLSWIGFVATTHLVHILYERRSLSLWLINIGYHFVEILLMSILLTLWV